jgi:exopolysaccharide production protein ExoZ
VALIAAGVLGYAATPVFSLHIEAWRIVQWGLPALAIVTGAVMLERAGKVAWLRAPHFLGDASYSLYLTHGFAVSAAFKLAGKLRLPTDATVALAVVAGLAVGVAAYKLVEQPLLRLAKYRARRSVAARSAALAPAP